MQNAKSIRSFRDDVRQAVLQAIEIESSKGPFNLKGRGHEDRVTLSRSLAAIVRGEEIPRLYISGYGPNYFYPKRIFETAQKIIKDQPGKLKLNSYESTVYIQMP
jgi:hypothetical protein